MPILSQAAAEGVEKDLFHCNNIPERVRMLMILSGDLFDGHRPTTPATIDVFIDTAEKILGAAPGTMDFIRGLIQHTEDIQ